MTRIWERLFLGSLADAEDLAEANPHSISTVISLCEVCVASQRRGVNYLSIPIEDDRPVPVGQFDCIMDAIAENIRWGTVLLHCAEGVSRAPGLTAAWMAAVGYKNIDAALAEVKYV
jgi:protein-tyrosine phosphatase